jgi:hypothetical protein
MPLVGLFCLIDKKKNRQKEKTICFQKSALNRHPPTQPLSLIPSCLSTSLANRHHNVGLKRAFSRSSRLLEWYAVYGRVCPMPGLHDQKCKGRESVRTQACTKPPVHCLTTFCSSHPLHEPRSCKLEHLSTKIENAWSERVRIQALSCVDPCSPESSFS